VALLVENRQMIHRTTTMPPRSERVTERVPISHILESLESMGVMGVLPGRTHPLTATNSYLTLRQSALEALGKNSQQAGVTCRI